THSLEGCCSIQLSYRTLYFVVVTPHSLAVTISLSVALHSYTDRWQYDRRTDHSARRNAKFSFFQAGCKNTAFFLILIL
ncbi:MAG: hypothetical protein M0P40_05160, partial [Bacteroidales bacterium]|nr:hypothetical protein [Bacteroidales bacterium]